VIVHEKLKLVLVARVKGAHSAPAAFAAEGVSIPEQERAGALPTAAHWAKEESGGHAGAGPAPTAKPLTVCTHALPPVAAVKP
jgi:hypothetical protein